MSRLLVALGVLAACTPSEEASDVHGRNPNLPILSGDTGIPVGEELDQEPGIDFGQGPFGPIDDENLLDSAEEIRDTDGDVDGDEAFGNDGLPGTQDAVLYTHGGQLRPLDSPIDGLVRLGLAGGLLAVDMATRGQMPGDENPVWLHGFSHDSSTDARCPQPGEPVTAPAYWPLLSIRTDHNGWVDREYEMVTGNTPFPDLSHMIVVMYDPDGRAIACTELVGIPPRPSDTIDNATGDPGEPPRGLD